ncbi:MAG: amino acid adenylation domain-containing protein [Candidatus Bruticola sp.]
MESVLSLYRQAVASFPHKPAVIFNDQTLTYSQIENLSEKVANYLHNNGVKRGKRVAILLDQSAYAIALILAVFKTGASYVPLDANYPYERLKFMMHDAQTDFLICDKDLLNKSLECQCPILGLDELESLPNPVTPSSNFAPLKNEDTAAVLYTSGSTGIPKGIKIPWRALNTYINVYKELVELTPQSRVTAYASFSFDANILETYPPICTGSSLYIIPKEIRLNFHKLSVFLEQNEISHTFMTTQAAFQFLSRFDSAHLRYLITGGEKLPSFTPCRRYTVVNLYGPTETLCSVSAFKVDKYYSNIPIGFPHRGTRFYILDENRHILPAGTWGELYIASPQIMLGYIKRPKEEQKALIANPFYKPDQEETCYKYLYRSGDKAMLDEHGCCLIGGRIDRQVKVRGFRVELSEIEDCLSKYKGIRNVAVKAWPSTTQGSILTAYYSSDKILDEQSIINYIKAQKPYYMVPQLVHLENLPLNVNHKIDYQALPEPNFYTDDFYSTSEGQQKALEAAAAADNANASPAELKLLEIVKSILKRSVISRRDNFWNLGLNSLGLINLLSDIYEQMHISIDTADIYKCTNIAELAAIADSTSADSSYITANSIAYPLSAVQHGIYLDSIRFPYSCMYNNPILVEFSKEIVDFEHLHQALNKVISTYPILKSYLREMVNAAGNPEPLIFTDEPQPFTIEIKEIADYPPAAGTDYNLKPFHFLRGDEPFTKDAYLSRFALWQNKKFVYLFIDVSHLIMDGQSLRLILSSLQQAYQGQKLDIDDYRALKYAAKEHQEASLQSDLRKIALNYYQKLLNDQDNDMTMPGADTSVSLRNQGSSLNLHIDTINIVRLESYCRKIGVTPNALLCSVFGYVLANFSGKEYVIFNSIYNVRPNINLNSAVGMFTRTYPIKINLNADLNTISFFKETQQQITSNLRYINCPYEELVSAFKLKNLPSLIYQGDSFDNFEFNQHQIEYKQLDHEENGVLGFEVYTNKQGLRLRVSWQEPLYNQKIAEGLAEAYLTALNSCFTADKISQIKILSEKAQAFLDEINSTTENFIPCATIERFEQAAAAHSSKTAVISGSISLTYDELNKRSNALARFLLKQTTGSLRNTPIAIMTERSVNAYIGRLAVMKAGGAFTCLESAWPDDRLLSIFKECGVPMVITTEKIKEAHADLWKAWPQGCVVELDKFNFDSQAHSNLTEIEHLPNDLAYIIYTSGSTGRPKGVMIEDHSFSHLAAPLSKNVQNTAILKNSQVCTAWCALTFDVSVLEFIVPLCSGRCVLLTSEEEIHSPDLLGQTMLKHKADSFTCVPSYLINSLESTFLCQAISNLKSIMLGGENFSSYLYKKLKELNPKLHIYNCYGPSETTVSCSAKLITDDEDTSIGRPISNMQFYILNRFGTIMPLGALGELVISGEGVGRGYAANPNLTKKSFINLKGRRAYRSGDAAWWDYEGYMHILGRLDNQVKLNGLRIELDEITSLMLNYPSINSAASALKKLGQQTVLCAYFTANEQISPSDLKTYLRHFLPPYMVPKYYIQLSKLPLNPNGKTDLKLLPDPQLTSNEEYTAPRSPAEKQFCAIFSEVLRLERNVSIKDSFFDLGGDSLKATKVVLAAEKCNLPITYSDVFEHSTPLELAEAAEKNRQSSTKAIETPEDITNYDYTEINKLLEKNSLDNWDPKYRLNPGNIILTGATGFLGIHILRTFLENYRGHCYCIMRRGKQKNLKLRLQGLLVYYFSSDFEEYFLNDRITLIEGDITEKETFDRLNNLPVDTLFNCSASVRHFDTDDLLNKVNVIGTQNIANYCLTNHIRLIHISTSSVAGISLDGTPSPFEPMTEHMLYFGQQMDNKYMLSKFRGERIVFEHILKGLEGKVMRAGNLMARNQDGEFQINVNANSFANKLRAYHTIGCVSYEDSGAGVELSPIDFTAEAILLLSQTPRCCCLFHPFSNRTIYMYDLIKMMRRQGLIIDQCLQEQFIEAFRETVQNNNHTDSLSSLIAYRSIAKGHTLSELKADNTYTMQALYRLHFNWPLISEAYLGKFINSLDSLGFFDNLLFQN